MKLWIKQRKIFIKTNLIY